MDTEGHQSDQRFTRWDLQTFLAGVFIGSTATVCALGLILT